MPNHACTLLRKAHVDSTRHAHLKTGVTQTTVAAGARRATVRPAPSTNDEVVRPTLWQGFYCANSGKSGRHCRQRVTGMIMTIAFRSKSVIAQQRMQSRAGLTMLEFVGCFIAVVGGAWLGALYLGVDVKNVAYTALSESKMLEKMPPEWRPEGPQDKAMTREQLLTTLREELGSLRNQIGALQSGKNENAAGQPQNPDADAAAQLPTKEKTVAYWSRLNEIAMGEAALQKDAESAFNAANAAKVFAIKGRISRFAAKAVDAVPTWAVDDSAVRFGRQLGLWYDHGGELYEKAVRIWETPIGPQARTQLNDEWKHSDQHHHNEAKLLHEKAAAVRGSLGRVYGEEFTEFAKPAGSVENIPPKANAA